MPFPFGLDRVAETAGRALSAAADVLEARRKPAAAVAEPPKQARTGYLYGVPEQGVQEYSAPALLSEQDRRAYLQELHDAYLRCPWVWTSVNAIARRITAGGLEFVYDPPGGRVDGDSDIPDKPAEVQACERLFAFCNDRQNLKQLLRRTIVDLLVFGDGMIEVVWSGRIPVALYGQDLPTTTPETDNHGQILSYKQTTDYGQKATFEPRQILHISLDATRPGVFGASPVAAALVPINTWLFAAATLMQGYRKGDPLNLHVDLPTSMSQPDQRRWVTQYMTRNVGPANAGYPLVTAGGGQVHELGARRVESNLSVLKEARDQIVSTIGVPPAKAGIIESGNLGGGTGESQDKDFDSITCDPIAALVLEVFQFHIAFRGFGIVDWKLRFSEVDTRDSQTIEGIREQRYKNGAITLNEWRSEIGKAPVDGGDQALVLAAAGGSIVRVRDLDAAAVADLAKKLTGSGWEIDSPGDEDDPITLRRAPEPEQPAGGPFGGQQDGAEDTPQQDVPAESAGGEQVDEAIVRTARGARKHGVPIGEPTDRDKIALTVPQRAAADKHLGADHGAARRTATHLHVHDPRKALARLDQVLAGDDMVGGHRIVVGALRAKVAALAGVNPAAKASDEPQTGGMIALLPDAETAERLTVAGGLPAGELHLTLAYLGGDVTTLDDDVRSEIPYAVRSALAEAGVIGPVDARAFSHSTFNADGGPDGDREPCAVYGIGDSDLLAPLHAAVVEMLEDVDGLTVPAQHSPFVPHTTAGYGLTAADLSYTGEVRFDRVVVALAGDWLEIPLSDELDEATEAELLDADVAQYVDEAGALWVWDVEEARYVASAAGVKRYGLPMGSLITAKGRKKKTGDSSGSDSKGGTLSTGARRSSGKAPSGSGPAKVKLTPAQRDAARRYFDGDNDRGARPTSNGDLTVVDAKAARDYVDKALDTAPGLTAGQKRVLRNLRTKLDALTGDDSDRPASKAAAKPAGKDTAPEKGKGDDDTPAGEKDAPVGKKVADQLARSSNPARDVKALDTGNLQAADKEFTRRAEAIGKPDEVSKTHKAVKAELARRADDSDGDADIDSTDDGLTYTKPRKAGDLSPEHKAFLKQFSAEERPEDQGQSAYTRIVTDPKTGRKMVYKRSDHGGSEDIEAEVLGYLVAGAVGVKAPRVRRLDDNAVAMDFVPGRTAGAMLTDRGASRLEYDAWWQRPEGDRIAVLDYITGNRDRNPGNAMVDDDGELWAIDHGAILPLWEKHGIEDPGEHVAVFSEFGNEPWKRKGVTADMLDGMESELVALRREFARVGGDSPLRHEIMMQRFGQLRARVETHGKR